MQQPDQNVVALAEVAEAELSARSEDSVDSVTLHEIIMGVNDTSLEAWAHANFANLAPNLSPEARQEYIDKFLLAAEIVQKWEPGEGSNMLDLYAIEEGSSSSSAASVHSDSAGSVHGSHEGDGEAAASA